MSFHDTQLLIHAAKNGDTEAVRTLLHSADPLWNSSLALMRAAEYGHLECVELLMAVSDPRHHASRALMMAVKRGQDACMDALFDCSDPEKVLQILRKDKCPVTPSFEAFEGRVLRLTLKNILAPQQCVERKRRVL